MTIPSAQTEPTRAEMDALTGATLLEFGTSWCGYCIAAQPLIGEALKSHPGLRHIKVEDGSGRALGRSYRVKLWPTLIFLRDGQELERLIRPGDATVLAQALRKIDPANPL